MSKVRTQRGAEGAHSPRPTHRLLGAIGLREIHGGLKPLGARARRRRWVEELDVLRWHDGELCRSVPVNDARAARVLHVCPVQPLEQLVVQMHRIVHVGGPRAPTARRQDDLAIPLRHSCEGRGKGKGVSGEVAESGVRP